MHAGDALWRLYGSVALLERHYPADARIGALAAKMREFAWAIGAHITVPEPSSVDLVSLMEVLQAELPEVGAPAAPAQTQRQSRGQFSDPEIIKAAQAFVGEMVASQLFDWANMVSDIDDKLNGSSPFFTFRQARAVLNIARRGEFDDGLTFMDQMEDSLPEAVRAHKEWAAHSDDN